jgi:predicted nucleic acid-binding Zn ribbon protein
MSGGEGISRTCDYCDSPLPASAPGRQRFCCAAHRASWHGQRRPLPPLGSCDYCDRPLPPGRSRYCSDRCGARWWHERQDKERRQGQRQHRALAEAARALLALLPRWPATSPRGQAVASLEQALTRRQEDGGEP